jgi:hypothetical protein
VQLPVYNKAPYLRECLDSILAQTFTDFEIIAVDDASTDGSWDILREYAARDRRFRLFRHEPNQGVLAARKHCFEEARGNYMTFVDADDLVAPDMIASLFELADNRFDFVQCAARVHNPDGFVSEKFARRYDRGLRRAKPVTLFGQDVLRGLSSGLVKWNLCFKLVSRKAYRAILPYIPSERVPQGEDVLLMLMLAFFSDSCRNMDRVLYYVRANPSSSNLTRIGPEKALEHIESLARSKRCGEEFVRRVAPDSDLNRPPYVQYFIRLAGSSASMTAHCVRNHPASRDALVAAYRENFGELSNLYLSRISGARLSFLGWLRKSVRRQWAAWRIRRSGLFFPDWYRDQNLSVKESGADPLRHYVRSGAQEGCNPNPLFDSFWYLCANPAVASSGQNPLLHYISRGWREGRDPSPRFSVADYLRLHPDVAKAGVEPLGHCLARGHAGDPVTEGGLPW